MTPAASTLREGRTLEQLSDKLYFTHPKVTDHFWERAPLKAPLLPELLFAVQVAPDHDRVAELSAPLEYPPRAVYQTEEPEGCSFSEEEDRSKVCLLSRKGFPQTVLILYKV